MDAIWIESKYHWLVDSRTESHARRPASRHGAVAIFHPNSATCLDMVAWGLWYYKVQELPTCLCPEAMWQVCGMSALLVTMGGYAGSEGDSWMIRFRSHLQIDR